MRLFFVRYLFNRFAVQQGSHSLQCAQVSFISLSSFFSFNICLPELLIAGMTAYLNKVFAYHFARLVPACSGWCKYQPGKHCAAGSNNSSMQSYLQTAIFSLHRENAVSGD